VAADLHASLFPRLSPAALADAPIFSVSEAHLPEFLFP